MRWEGLFADLEAQAEALSAAERAAEVEERTRHEFGQASLSDRLRPAVGQDLQLSCEGGATVRGRLVRLGGQWCLIDEGAGREAVVALSAVSVIAGLGRLSAPADSAGLVESRLGMPHILRALARDRSTVRIQLKDASTLDGTMDRVGADFVEVAAHAAGESRRRAEVRAILVVATGGLAVVRRLT
jgi:hypothetical protein